MPWVSEEDWKHLGMQALQENQVETARNAVRICDIKSISLLSHVEQGVSSACDLEVAKKLVRAKILAFQYKGRRGCTPSATGWTARWRCSAT